MRQVHWKQSARQGELLVKLHETSETAQRSLLLVTDAAAYADDAVDRQSNRFPDMPVR